MSACAPGRGGASGRQRETKEASEDRDQEHRTEDDQQSGQDGDSQAGRWASHAGTPARIKKKKFYLFFLSFFHYEVKYFAFL